MLAFAGHLAIARAARRPRAAVQLLRRRPRPARVAADLSRPRPGRPRRHRRLAPATPSRDTLLVAAVVVLGVAVAALAVLVLRSTARSACWRCASRRGTRSSWRRRARSSASRRPQLDGLERSRRGARRLPGRRLPRLPRPRARRCARWPARACRCGSSTTWRTTSRDRALGRSGHAVRGRARRRRRRRQGHGQHAGGDRGPARPRHGRGWRMRRPDPADLAARLGARAGTRRSFLARVGAAALAVAGGRMVAAAVAPEEAQSFHFCGHTFTTGSCPHPGEHPAHRRARPPAAHRTTASRSTTSAGSSTATATRRRAAAQRLAGPDGPLLPRAPRTRICEDWVPEQLRLRRAPAGLLVPLLRRPDPQAHRLLREPPNAHQRRRGAARLLLRAAATSSASPTTTPACRADRGRARTARPDRGRLRRLDALRSLDGRDHLPRRVRDTPPHRLSPRPLRRGRDRRRRAAVGAAGLAGVGSAGRSWPCVAVALALPACCARPGSVACRCRSRAARCPSAGAASCRCRVWPLRLRRRPRRRRPHLPAGRHVPGRRRRRDAASGPTAAVLALSAPSASAASRRLAPRPASSIGWRIALPADAPGQRRRAGRLALALFVAPRRRRRRRSPLGAGSQLDPAVADDGTLAYTQRADDGTTASSCVPPPAPAVTIRRRLRAVDARRVPRLPRAGRRHRREVAHGRTGHAPAPAAGRSRPSSGRSWSRSSSGHAQARHQHRPAHRQAHVPRRDRERRRPRAPVDRRLARRLAQDQPHQLAHPDRQRAHRPRQRRRSPGGCWCRTPRCAAACWSGSSSTSASPACASGRIAAGNQHPHRLRIATPRLFWTTAIAAGGVYVTRWNTNDNHAFIHRVPR